MKAVEVFDNLLQTGTVSLINFFALAWLTVITNHPTVLQVCPKSESLPNYK